MSRSGYREDLDQWELIRWRGAVAAAIKGKRGQTLLKELEASLLALPEKGLCKKDFVDPSDETVCALGAVALKRKLDSGKDKVAAFDELAKEFPSGTMAEEVSKEFNIADALAQEITYINDEWGSYGCSDKERYEIVLKWVQENIKKEDA